jgi:hypothetical protein
MKRVQRGFAAKIAALAGRPAREYTSHHSRALVLVVDWLLYWSRPCTWRRARAHLVAWLTVRAWWPTRDMVRRYVVACRAHAHVRVDEERRRSVR